MTVVQLKAIVEGRDPATFGGVSPDIIFGALLLLGPTLTQQDANAILDKICDPPRTGRDERL